MAVNLKALDLLDPELPTLISGLLHEARLPPSRLALEITESAVMRDTMGLRVIAEGVEGEDAWRELKALGCDMAQGCVVSRPLPSDQSRLPRSGVSESATAAANASASIPAR